MFIMEIIVKRDPETIQKEAIRNVLAIATANQSRVRDGRKTNLNHLAETVKKNLSRKVKRTLRSFLMRFANALMLPTGHASPDNTRPGAQALIAREQRETLNHDTNLQVGGKTAKDQLLRHDKKLNDIISFMDPLAKDKNISGQL